MEQSKIIRAKKMMLWFSMISISMTFAGLTSAYVVSKSRPDWLEDFSLPMSLYWSTIVILLSSVTFWQANKKLTSQPKATASLLWVTLALALAFVFLCWLDSTAGGETLNDGWPGGGYDAVKCVNDIKFCWQSCR